LAFFCRSTTWQQGQPDGTIVEGGHYCGDDGLRIVSLADGSYRVIAGASSADVYYRAPSWSPDGQSIAVSASGGDCDGYELFNVTTGARTNCFYLPVASEIGGACGGSAESGASDWSPDGRLLAYHWQFRTGQNGVALVDVITGERRLIQTTGASSVSFAGNGQHLTFGASGYVWTADVDGSDIFRLADGQGPAWQPVP
jgi:Tol biopolymer transport system component